MFRKLFITAVASVSLTVAAQAQTPPQQPQQPQQKVDVSTALIQNAHTSQGQYFAYALAPTFKAQQESTNAVIIGSEKLCSMYGVMGWLGLPGQSGPDNVAGMYFQCMQLPGMHTIGAKQVQPAAGFSQAASYDFAYTLNGQAFRGTAVINVVSNGYSTNGSVQFYATKSEQFAQLQPALSRLAGSCVASGANTFGATDMFAATRPRGDYGIGDWKPYNADPTNDRLSRHREEEMLEFDTVHDPETGITYKPTWDQYNKERGGYVNPNDPTQLLHNGPAWDPEK